MNDLKERERLAMEEYKDLIRWANEEEDRVVERLKREGREILGLDTHREEFAYIKDIVRERLKEIIKKYDLPYEIKW